MAKQQVDVNSRGIGLELYRRRKDTGLSCEDVGDHVGKSASTISRIETGKRVASTDEVASILEVLGVKGVAREKLISKARRRAALNRPDDVTSTEQSCDFRDFEQRATKMVHFEPMLVPGLAQTGDYAHAVLAAVRVGDREEDLEPWVGKRMQRKSILHRETPPQLQWIVTELGLRQPVGGAKVMAKQVRCLIDESDRPNITVNVVPSSVAAHPGLAGQFLIMEFADEPTIAYVEDRTTGLFLDDEDKVLLYRRTAEKLTELALDEQRSKRLLRSIASDLERE